MVSKTVKVVNEQGMHMRPAGELAKAVKAHPDCEVTFNANGKTVKAKAPMQITPIKKRIKNQVKICTYDFHADFLFPLLIGV